MNLVAGYGAVAVLIFLFRILLRCKWRLVAVQYYLLYLQEYWLVYITTCIIDWKCLKLIQMVIVLQLAKVAMAPKAYNFVFWRRL